MNTAAFTKLTNARTNLLLDEIFFGRLALYLKLVEDTSEQTLAVDGTHIFYNPDFVLGLSNELTKSAIVHEISHCIFEHPTRRGGRDPELWNRAADYAIHNMMVASKYTIGKTWLYDVRFNGMSAEAIYEVLKQEQSEGKSGGPGLCNVRNGQTSPAEVTAQRQEWKVAVSQAAAQAQKAGKVPAGMERFVEEMVQNKVPWQEKLQRFVTTLAKNDYVWTRPNKRFLHHNLIMPSLYSEQMDILVLVGDDSGSIGQAIMDAFAAEVNAARAQTRPVRTIYISCDAAVNYVQDMEATDEFVFASKGGGSTDFRPPFEWLKEQDITPNALIYLTDMYGSFPKDPGYPVLWCATTDVQGPFGETLKIEI